MTEREDRTVDFRAGGSTKRPEESLGSGQHSGLRIRCPQCHQPIVVVQDDLASDILCSTCGSSFNLVDDTGATYEAAAVKSIAQFEFIEQLGAGAFGTVWEGSPTS